VYCWIQKIWLSFNVNYKQMFFALQVLEITMIHLSNFAHKTIITTPFQT
jgi:hypothetical protein